MLRKAFEALKCLLTRMMDGNDASADSIVICGTLMTVGLFSCAILAVILGRVFDFQGYGIGAGAILAGMGAGTGGRTWLKGQVGANPPPKVGPNNSQSVP